MARMRFASALLQLYKREVLQFFSPLHILPEARPREKTGIVYRFALGAVSGVFFLDDEWNNPDCFSVFIYEKRMVLGVEFLTRTEIKLMRKPGVPYPSVLGRVHYLLPELGCFRHILYINCL